jgi:hypothetical protein
VSFVQKTAVAGFLALASTSYAVGAVTGEIPPSMIPEPHTIADFAVLTLVGYIIKDRRTKVNEAKQDTHHHESPIMAELKSHRIDFAEFAGQTTARLEALGDRILRVENYCDSQHK